MGKDLKAKLNDVPHEPGIYRFLDASGAVIYVGKAKDLRRRLTQYFSGHDDRPQLPYLMRDAANFDYTVVSSELASAMLENTLIKEHLPKYNIDLKDDKNFAFITLDYGTEIPQLGYARKFDRTKKQVRYFGPYSAAHKIKSTLRLLRRIFPYCAAEKVTSRPCFYYYLHRCPGVCVGKISLADYRTYLEKIETFLRGKTADIQRQLKGEMQRAAAGKRFELAARLRDQFRVIELLEEKQPVILNKPASWDVASVSVLDGFGCVNLFQVRGGKLRDKENFVFDLRAAAFPEPRAVLSSFVDRYYLETSNLPRELYVQFEPEDAASLAALLRERAGRIVSVSVPKRGKAAELTGLGAVNAAEHLKQWLGGKASEADRLGRALLDLKDVLDLSKIPRRIECYDNSHIQGSNVVSSMVVFENGAPKKSEYRKFKVLGENRNDDFAAMRETLTRRFARLPQKAGDGKPAWPEPDLLVIDGGKGQLGAALEAMKETGVELPAIGLAKRIEEIFLPKKPEPIVLPHSHPALQLLQRLRDEAHRFGITFHRQLRSKQAVQSALDAVPGVGPVVKKKLKAKFGTVAAIRMATVDELAAVVGPKLAQALKEQL